MTASVTSPSGITELCDVVSLDDCHYSIKFVPNEMGIHTVSVKHKDMHIPGKCRPVKEIKICIPVKGMEAGCTGECVSDGTLS